jgi:hypothetical protein
MALPGSQQHREYQNFRDNGDGSTSRFVFDATAHDLLQQAVDALGGTAGTQKHFSDDDVTTPGIEQIVISQVVPVGKSWKIYSASASCKSDLKVSLYKNTALINSSRNNPASSDAQILLLPYLSATAGDTIEIKLLSAGYNAASDVTSFLNLVEM